MGGRSSAHRKLAVAAAAIATCSRVRGSRCHRRSKPHPRAPRLMPPLLKGVRGQTIAEVEEEGQRPAKGGREGWRRSAWAEAELAGRTNGGRRRRSRGARAELAGHTDGARGCRRGGLA
ncbi:hypothetical protein PR202_gb11084 [Eleusine coracana subsp. coracana]|uniref:Uncharacterized protein n=1 Tax=Eleusine coracana subsp. coracana TaxID=191504 RepID=A0AAV5EL69_ELECO|nr:hypothetical protein PR202_gb11084 [Eleusine coracana subsp. coracana]